jgi:hypothetical protein
MTPEQTIANAIMPQCAAPAMDSEGILVSSLTEAVMGMTSAIGRIATALEMLVERHDLA